MDFYKNIKVTLLTEDTFKLEIKINDMFSQTIILKSDQLEYLINSYRQFKTGG